MEQIEIRSPRTDEFTAFQRFLERCYGHSYGFFLRHYPHLNQGDELSLASSLIAAQGGEILSHVGAFPLEIIAGPARIKAGGIGGVATLPQARGKGLMSRLMAEAIALMRRRGEVLSVLWGDRQRYRHFGYESCGLMWNLTLTARSLAAAGVQPIPVEEADPTDPAAAAQVAAWHQRLAFRVERPHLPQMLAKEGVRVFLSDRGYGLARGEGRDLRLLEVAAAEGDEPGIVAGIMARAFANSASLDVVPADAGPAARLARAAARWSVSPQGMFRILDWPGLLRALQPLLAERARFLAPFELAVGCRDQDRVDVATLRWDGAQLAVESGRAGSAYIELDSVELVGLVLGGPTQLAGAQVLSHIFPVPLHVPLLDHV